MRAHLLVGLALLTGFAPAQQPASRPRLAGPSSDVDVIRAQLAATSATAIAWGGYNAALACRPELAADVQGALARAARLEDHDRWTCEAALLDALVRLDVRMDPAELRSWWSRGHQHVALVVAARERERAVPFLLQAFAEDTHGVTGQAICNLLLATAPRQLVPAIAGRLQVTVRFRVDEGVAVQVIPGFGLACSMRTSGFPPSVAYEFVTEPEPGDVLLAAGPIPVHVRRETRTGGRCRPFETDDAAVAAEGNDYRLQCLAHVLGVPLDDLELRGQPEARHTWQDAASFHEAVGVALADARTAWRRLFERLVERRLLARSDVPAPRVTVCVDDDRDDRSEPLPAPRDGRK